MPNRRLTQNELSSARELLGEIRERLALLSDGDPELLFAFRRKLFKELTYDERSSPMVRRKVKAAKRLEQRGLCVVCQQSLPDKYAVLDRLVASAGYTVENTRLIHQDCDIQAQVSRGYA